MADDFRHSAFGGLLLATTMVFAVLTHLFVVGGDPAPAVALLLVNAACAWLRRRQLTPLLPRR